MSAQSTSQFVIRKATLGDTPALLSLIKSLARYERLSDQVVATIDSLRPHGFHDRSFYQALLCEANQGRKPKPVGFALYFFTYSNESNTHI